MFMRDLGVKGAVSGDFVDFDCLWKGLNKGLGGVLSAGFFVGVDALHGGHKLGIEGKKVFPYLFGIFETLGSYLLELRGRRRDGSTPFGEEREGTGPAFAFPPRELVCYRIDVPVI